MIDPYLLKTSLELAARNPVIGNRASAFAQEKVRELIQVHRHRAFETRDSDPSLSDAHRALVRAYETAWGG